MRTLMSRGAHDHQLVRLGGELGYLKVVTPYPISPYPKLLTLALCKVWLGDNHVLSVNLVVKFYDKC